MLCDFAKLLVISFICNRIMLSGSISPQSGLIIMKIPSAALTMLECPENIEFIFIGGRQTYRRGDIALHVTAFGLSN